MPTDLTGDDPEQCAAVRRGHERHLGRTDVLVTRRGHLLGTGEVDPQLDAVEEAAARDELFGRCLDVQDSGPCGHPLGVPVGDEATPADGVLMPERPVDHVGDRLEATMRMPGSAFRLTRGVLDLPHLVHMDERVESAPVDAGERPANRKPFSLEPLGSGRDRDHRSRLRRGSVHTPKPG